MYEKKLQTDVFICYEAYIYIIHINDHLKYTCAIILSYVCDTLLMHMLKFEVNRDSITTYIREKHRSIRLGEYVHFFLFLLRHTAYLSAIVRNVYYFLLYDTYA